MINDGVFLNANRFEPKYSQLYQLFLYKIKDGVWEPGQKIPTEKELIQQYAVSRITVRKALDLLAQRDFISRIPGKGTYVLPPKPQYSVQELLSFSEAMRDRGLVPGQEILAFETISAGQRLSRKLRVLPGTEIVLIVRTRLVDGEPIGIHTSYLHFENHRKLLRADLEQSGSVYLILRSQFGIIPREARETIEACAADEETSNILGVAIGSPMLLIERDVFSDQGEPFEFVELMYRADRYKYYVNLYQVDTYEHGGVKNEHGPD